MLCQELTKHGTNLLLYVTLGSQMWNIDRLVRGDPNIKSIKSDHKVIRIFTSSTFTGY